MYKRDSITNLADELLYAKYWIKITRFCNISTRMIFSLQELAGI